MDEIEEIIGSHIRLYDPDDYVSTYYNQVAILKVPPLYPMDYTDDVAVFLNNRDTVVPSGTFLQWVMTPETKTIVRSIFLPFTNPGSLCDLYPTNHEHLVQYVQDHQPLRCQCIIVDHVDPTFVDIIDNIKINV